jgi:hypothetical protein
LKVSVSVTLVVSTEGYVTAPRWFCERFDALEDTTWYHSIKITQPDLTQDVLYILAIRRSAGCDARVAIMRFRTHVINVSLLHSALGPKSLALALLTSDVDP